MQWSMAKILAVVTRTDINVLIYIENRVMYQQSQAGTTNYVKPLKQVAP